MEEEREDEEEDEDDEAIHQHALEVRSQDRS
jgi:hypothetical protein